MADRASDVLDQARRDIGYSRWSDPEKGTKYGRWFRDVLKWGSYYGENGVPYCGMAVSYWFAMAGASCPGLPGAYTPTMANDGRKAGREVPKGQARAGDVVYFDWGPDGTIDHVGIVESGSGSYLTTIEGNTGNGQVLRRTRALSTVACVVRPPYGGAASQPSGGSGLVEEAQRYLSKWGYPLGPSGVDGSFGPDTRRATVRYVQHNMACYGERVDVDGDCGPKTKAAWSRLGGVRRGCSKVYLVKAVQISLMCHGVSVGPDGIDGSAGPDTDSGIRSYQRSRGLEADGSVGPATFASLFG